MASAASPTRRIDVVVRLGWSRCASFSRRSERPGRPGRGPGTVEAPSRGPAAASERLQRAPSLERPGLGDAGCGSSVPVRPVSVMRIFLRIAHGCCMHQLLASSAGIDKALAAWPLHGHRMGAAWRGHDDAVKSPRAARGGGRLDVSPADGAMAMPAGWSTGGTRIRQPSPAAVARRRRRRGGRSVLTRDGGAAQRRDGEDAEARQKRHIIWAPQHCPRLE